MGKKVLNSPRLREIKKKRFKALRKKVVFFSVLFLFLILLLSFLSRWQEININQIEVSGNKITDTSAIDSVALNEMQGYYLWVIPKTNFLFYPRQNIKSALEDKFKRLKDISFSLKNSQILVITVSERNAAYTWCGNTPEEDTGLTNDKGETQKSICYYLDENGYIFDQAPYFSGNVYFKLYGKPEDPENPLGSYFQKENFHRLVALRKSIRESGFRPIAFFTEDTGDLKISLMPESSKSTIPEIFLKMDSDFDKAMENLQSVLSTEPLQSDIKNKYSSLLYIDLRFGNKVYYKFK